MIKAGLLTDIDSIHTDDDLSLTDPVVFSDAELIAFYDGNILFFGSMIISLLYM
jgi:hypothetical protein